MHFMKTFIFNPHSSLAKKALLVNFVGSVLPHKITRCLLQWICLLTTQNMNSKDISKFRHISFRQLSKLSYVVGNTAMVTTDCCTFGTKVWKLTAMLLRKNFYHTAQFINDGHGLNFFGHWTWYDRRLVMSWGLYFGIQCALEKW